MDAVLRRLHAQRAEALFLEVDETNLPAIALYAGLGFHEVGKRPAYYQTAGQRKASALVMRRDLG
jgi:[ribosomal protein S18]-alanine N-acetyltransferase